MQGGTAGLNASKKSVKNNPQKDSDYKDLTDSLTWKRKFLIITCAQIFFETNNEASR